MSQCKWVASDQPRVIIGRHELTCKDETCAGCQPCHEPHCRVCGIQHSDGACPECLTQVRDDLAAIVELCGSLPDEVEHRGVESEALNLLGPVANPEARGHLEASVAAGRVPPEYLEAGAETPLWTVGTWAMVYRAEFEHDEPLGAVQVDSEVGYLRRNLTYAATWPHVPFDDFARDLRRCRGHLEDVLRDGVRAERSRVTCDNPDCVKKPRLELIWTRDEKSDHWRCPACHRTYMPEDFRKAHARQLVHKGAEKFLPLRDAVSTLVAQGRPERTIRKWLAPPDPERGDDLDSVVGGFCEIATHKVWIWWPDLWRRHTTTPTRKRNAA